MAVLLGIVFDRPRLWRYAAQLALSATSSHTQHCFDRSKEGAVIIILDRRIYICVVEPVLCMVRKEVLSG
jgi:hypothetical protein